MKGLTPKEAHGGPASAGLRLVGVTEIAALARVKPDTVDKWRRRHSDFPTPIQHLAMGPVWNRPDIETWLAATGRG